MRVPVNRGRAALPRSSRRSRLDQRDVHLSHLHVDTSRRVIFRVRVSRQVARHPRRTVTPRHRPRGKALVQSLPLQPALANLRAAAFRVTAEDPNVTPVFRTTTLAASRGVCYFVIRAPNHDVSGELQMSFTGARPLNIVTPRRPIPRSIFLWGRGIGRWHGLAGAGRYSPVETERRTPSLMARGHDPEPLVRVDRVVLPMQGERFPLADARHGARPAVPTLAAALEHLDHECGDEEPSNRSARSAPPSHVASAGWRCSPRSGRLGAADDVV